ncbi:hypothetical protein PanWU01x14_004060 [Parasponia andersonii]|uniref:Uncharacterized protein n=1 Tax=Parasponia andersonii TaxID=3476 RepID=A0A2P5E328_PARAD|nr:hypothetical protein PanWU01x14_004060 [Parasponia andersonii]
MLTGVKSPETGGRGGGTIGGKGWRRGFVGQLRVSLVGGTLVVGVWEEAKREFLRGLV